MNSKDPIEISNGTVKIIISELEGRGLTPPELAAESILALTNSLDVKEFDNYGVYEKFEYYIRSIFKEMQGVCEWASWKVDVDI